MDCCWRKFDLFWSIQLFLTLFFFSSDSAVWRGRRKLLTPAFHFKILENFVPVFSRHTDTLMDAIESKCGDNISGLIDDVRPLYEDLTLNIINGKM